MIVNEGGTRISSCCPECGASEKRKKTHKSFGEFWQELCEACGHVYEKGVGAVPAVEGD